MAKTYNDILKVQIGRVKASAKVDNYFPVTGKTIQIDAETRWGQSSEWQIQDGSGDTTAVTGNLVHNKDSKQITVTTGGELQQKFIARNYLTQTVVSKMIYAMLPQVLPYFDVTATEIVRVGDTGYINIIAENGYYTSRSNTIVARIYREHESAPVKNIGFDTSRPGPAIWASSSYSFDVVSDRGIYDVEVDITDTATGVTFTKRINKLITVTPKLCMKPADASTGYEVVGTYRSQTSYGGAQTFELKLWRNVGNNGLHYAEAIVPLGDNGYGSYDRIPVHLLPAGTTLCLRKDTKEPNPDYPFRFLPTGNNDVNVTNKNGTPNFTYEAPLIVTHDSNSVFEWKWWAYGAVNMANNIRNVVLDGRGYHNTSIRFSPDETKSSNSCFFLVAGTSDFEVFSCDVDTTGFAGMSAKTDPSANQPHFWRSSGWVFNNLRIHHCTFQNTAGEGVYIGYYGSGKIKAKNSAGVDVEYYAHLLDNLRLYRCDFVNTGMDSIQVNNAIHVDICYCNTTGSGASKQGGQNYASSSVFDGRMYNCRFLRCNGPIAFCGPLLDEVHIYNNVMEAARYSGAFVSTLWKSSQDEHIDLDGDGVVDEIGMYIYNNVIKAYSLGSFNTDYTLTKYFMDDNIIITEIGIDKLPPMFTGGEGNVFIKAFSEYDYIDQFLKIADSANNNYQPNYNSSLVTSGKAGRSVYDIRGYKNWYNSKLRTGPYLGIYKDTSIVDSSLQLTGLSINNGAVGTTNRNVSVKFNYMGIPTRYRIAESADLSSISWMNWTGSTIDFTLSEGYGNKTVYAQIATSEFESDIVSTSVNYSGVIQFADAEVKRICVANWDKDGDGEISTAEAAAVTTIPNTYFKGNTKITSFDELVHFTGLTSIADYAFQACTALASISFPESLSAIGQQTFRSCTALSTINFPARMDEIKMHAFWGCTALKTLRLPDGITAANCGYQSGIEELYIPNSVETVSQFAECTYLCKVDIGTGVKSFLQNAFNADLAIEIFIIRATAIPSYAGWTLPDAFAGTIYVPDVLVETYKITAGWRNFSTRYKPLSEYVKLI